MPAPAPAVPPELLALVQRLESRLTESEKKLMESQERAVSATVRLQEKEAAQKEMEAMFQTLRSQQRAEETHQLERDMAAKMQGRIQALEERLDKQLTELQASWTASVREIVNTLKNQPAPPPPPELMTLEAEAARVRGELAELRKETEARREQAARLEEKSKHAEAREAEVRAVLASEDKRWIEASQRLENELARFGGEVLAVQTALPRVSEAEKALEERQRTLAQWGESAGKEIEALRRSLAALEPLPQELEEQRGADAERRRAVDIRLAELQALAEVASRDQQAVADYAEGIAATVTATSRSLEALERAMAGDLGKLRDQTSRRDTALEDGVRKLSDSISTTQRMVEEWQTGVERRVASIQSAWSGAIATVNDLAAGLRRENEAMLAPWRVKAEEIERKLATLQSAWPVFSQAIPEGILQKVRQEMFKLEMRLTELEHGRSPK